MIAPAQLLERLRWRYATKQFDSNRTIPAEIWDTLLESLVLTPSSFGLQPWQFIDVQSPALRQDLRTASWNQPQVTDASHFLVLAARTSVAAPDVDRYLAQLASDHAIATNSLAGYRNIILAFLTAMSPDACLSWAKHQAYIALGQLMSSAALLDLDTCPMEGLDPAAYDHLLGLTQRGLTVAVACAVGYRSPLDTSASRPKSRFPIHQVVTTA